MLYNDFVKNYVLTCCSTADLSDEIMKERHIPYVSFTLNIDGKIYNDDYGRSYPYDKFYADIKNGMQATTSQVNVEAYKEMFKTILDQGKDVLHLSLSSGISGTINSARIAAESLNEEYENKVYIVDSLCCSGGYGMLVMLAKDNQEKGFGIEENIQWLKDNRLKVIHWFFSSDLTSYIRGGRISNFAGFVGTALKICPLMCVSKEGKLEQYEKIRTKSKAIQAIVDKMKNELDDDYSGPCYMQQSACLEDALAVKALILEYFKKIDDVKIFPVGTVIGAHTGPGTVALYYLGKERAK